MKAKFVLWIAIVGIGAGALGWYAGKAGGQAPAVGGQRKIAFYQSPMHPWIKSDKPGNCTLCGMKLTPIYEGEKGFEIKGDIVMLGSNSIQVINVRSEPAQMREIERMLEVAGKIEADETRMRVLSAYVEGRIEKLFVNYVGAEVKAGEPLAILYSPALLSAEREYLSVIAQTNFANSPRMAEERRSLIDGAHQRLRRLGLTDADIEGLTGKGSTNLVSQILAPISGTIISRAVLEGQYVKEGDKLFEIADLSKLWFRFDVYEQDLTWIKSGVEVQVSSPALGTNRLSGPVTFIDPSINEAARSARVRVELDNPLMGARRGLYNGLYAEGRLHFQDPAALTVPRSAVLNPGDFPRVYIDNGGGAYELRRVKIGRRGAEYWEVLEGVEEKELVVTSGNLMLDGQTQINQTASQPVHSHDQGGASHDY